MTYRKAFNISLYSALSLE